VTKILRSVAELEAQGLLQARDRSLLEQVAKEYAIGVTPAMARLIDPADPMDPIGLQFLPDPRELIVSAEERADPIGDDAHSPVDGIVHRYPDRALLKLVHICPVYCRFCFRREMVGPDKGDALDEATLEKAFAYLEAHPEIWEVVVTGGDPLILSARRLAAVSQRLATLPHVKIIRWHSRVPVVMPEVVDDALVEALQPQGKTTWLAVHANHPRELTQEAREALKRLSRAGVHLVSQTVLLKGINDNAETLADLMRAFVEAGVKPYYLHQGDFAKGTGHWRTSLAEGQILMRQLRGQVSGLAQPVYVVDIPGGHGKVPVSGPSCDIDERGDWHLTDWQGKTHLYPPRAESIE